MGEFWTDQLGRPVEMPVVVDPARDTVPADCRSALDLQTAFTCPDDKRVYLTPRFVEALRDADPADDVWYRFAATMSHEMGHVVQVDKQVPGVRDEHPTATASQRIEQQADCLSGVWADAVGIDGARFRRAAREVYQIIDSPFERRTHGEPDERIAAIKHGQSGDGAAACGLAGR